MRVWTCNDFKGYWPVGSAAVVVADSESEARAALDDELRRMGLDGLRDRDEVVELDTTSPRVSVLWDGNY